MLPLLHGFRILDLTKLFTLATSRLADLGADVIKVEEPPIGDYLRRLPPLLPTLDTSLAYLMLNRNKRSVAVDLRRDEGRQVFLDLVATADAVVTLARPGAYERLGLGYEDLRAARNDIVYCAISGYGQDGLYRDLPSHSMNIDAAAGFLKIEQGPGGRPEIGPYTMIGRGMELGALHGALAVAAALAQRSRTGQGCYIDVSCWDAAASASQGFQAALNLGSAAQAFDATGEGGHGARQNVYGTADDKVILLCALEKKLWDRFCDVIEHPQWSDRGTWTEPMDFGTDDPTLRDDIEAVIRTRTRDDWMQQFIVAGVPASPVLDADELEQNPHTVAREMVVTSTDLPGAEVKYIRPPLQLPDAKFTCAVAPPRFGEHTQEILAEIGYPKVTQDQLIADGILFVPSHVRLEAQ